MSWFDNLSLRAKLVVNFFVSGSLLILAILVCYVQIDRLQQRTTEITAQTMPALALAGTLSETRMRYRIRSLEFMLAESDAEREKTEKSLQSIAATLSEKIAEYRGFVSTAEEASLLEAFIAATTAYENSVTKAVDLVRQGNRFEADRLQKEEWLAAGTQVANATSALVKQQNERGKQIRDASTAAAEQAKQIAIIALVAGSILAALLSILLAGRISGRLRHVVSAANDIAEGRLVPASGPAIARTRDEIGQLLQAVESMRSSLRDTIGQTRTSSSTLGDAAKDLGDGIGQLERSADAQSNAASSIAASIEELTVSINEVSTRTGEASKAAEESDAKARTGRSVLKKLEQEIDRVSVVVNTASEGIRNLADESRKISEIVNVIKEIADQTNLLALNAAIEAARAGEQGRGFAVVADEVRKLAERTAQSTGEITSTVDSIQHSTTQVVTRIDEGVSAVGRSVEHANEAGQSIESLLEIARRVAELIHDIDLALSEQSTASTEVARSVEGIAESADDIHNVTKETSAATGRLMEMSARMQEQVSRFIL